MKIVQLGNDKVQLLIDLQNKLWDYRTYFRHTKFPSKKSIKRYDWESYRAGYLRGIKKSIQIIDEFIAIERSKVNANSSRDEVIRYE